MTACCPHYKGSGIVPEWEVFVSDGPCEGTYLCAFAQPPQTIIGVVGGDRKPALLDLPDDRALEDDDQHHYELVGRVHINAEGKRCRWYLVYQSTSGRIADDQRVQSITDDIWRRRAYPGIPDRTPAPVIPLHRT